MCVDYDVGVLIEFFGVFPWINAVPWLLTSCFGKAIVLRTENWCASANKWAHRIFILDTRLVGAYAKNNFWRLEVTGRVDLAAAMTGIDIVDWISDESSATIVEKEYIGPVWFSLARLPRHHYASVVENEQTRLQYGQQILKGVAQIMRLVSILPATPGTCAEVWFTDRTTPEAQWVSSRST